MAGETEHTGDSKLEGSVNGCLERDEVLDVARHRVLGLSGERYVSADKRYEEHVNQTGCKKCRRMYKSIIDLRRWGYLRL